MRFNKSQHQNTLFYLTACHEYKLGKETDNNNNNLLTVNQSSQDRTHNRSSVSSMTAAT